MVETRGRRLQGIYKYPGPDNSVIYSNLPPDISRQLPNK
jgi:hypothetical protein